YATAMVSGSHKAEFPNSRRIHSRMQRFDVADAIGPAYPSPAYHLGNMVRNDRATEVNIAERLHDFVHVHVPIVHKGLDKIRERRADVAKVNLPELVQLREVADGFEYIFPHSCAAFQPGPGTQADPDVGAVGNLQGADISVEVAKDAARDSA